MNTSTRLNYRGHYVIVWLLLAIALTLLLFAPVRVHGQTNVPPQQTFLQTTATYFTSFNTNLLTFRTNDTIDVMTGPEYNQGLNVDDLLAGRWNAWHPSPSLNIGPSVTFRNAGIAGTLVSVGAGPFLSIVHWDAKLTLGIEPGYSWMTHHAYIEPHADVEKALTDNTYGGLRIGLPIDLRGHVNTPGAPLLAITLGFKL